MSVIRLLKVFMRQQRHILKERATHQKRKSSHESAVEIEKSYMKITRRKQNIANDTCTCLKERLEMAAARCSPSSAVTKSNGTKVATANTNPIGNHFKCFISVSRFQSVSWFLGSCPLDLTAYSLSKWGLQCSKVTSRSHSLWMWRIQHSTQTLHG